MKNTKYQQLIFVLAPVVFFIWAGGSSAGIGEEKSVPERLADGEEFALSPADLAAYGRLLLEANWTAEEGAGRPLTKGTGAPVVDPSRRLEFPHNFNRLSGPDANSCAGCHNAPYGIGGGAGDIVTNVAVLGQRFDFLNFDQADPTPQSGFLDELGRPTNMDTAFNFRATPGMFGGGYIEMLTRQITADLRALRDGLAPGGSVELVSKGISFGTLARGGDGSWDVSGVEGIPASSLGVTAGPPELTIRPWHQASRVVSLREFTNNAMNHHHGIQTTERFGSGDPDGDGFSGEMTVAEVTAASVAQAAMAPPGRLIPRNPEVEEANLNGERQFAAIGCATCHTPSLPLFDEGWIYTEPNPYNPAGNLRPGDAPTLTVDLTDNTLPLPRLKPSSDGTLYVPVFTDFKLHDITSGPDDPNREPLDMQFAPGSAGFFAGNGKFLSRRLWDCGKKPNHFHHGKFTTLRESILAHSGEALASRQAFEALGDYDRDSIIEFLKSLQVLPPGTASFIVDENYQPRVWPPERYFRITVADGMITIAPGDTGGIYPVPLRYQLQFSPDLVGGSWQDIGEPSNVPAFTVPKTGYSAEFYRIKVLPP
ncbi:MAG: di-heme oxidoredictase family protein [Verrucomicrobiales bacterium]